MMKYPKVTGYKTCPICGAELQATRAEWRSGVTVTVVGGALFVTNWGNHYDYADLGYGSNVYCANDHSTGDILDALSE